MTGTTIESSEDRRVSWWEKRRMLAVVGFSGVVIFDLLNLHGLLLLVVIAPALATLTYLETLRPGSLARRGRVARARRHAEEIESELGIGPPKEVRPVARGAVVLPDLSRYPQPTPITATYTPSAGYTIGGSGGSTGGMTYMVPSSHYWCPRCGSRDTVQAGPDPHIRVCNGCNYCASGFGG